MQLKRYNKQGLEHNTHAVAAEALLLLKSAAPVHGQPLAPCPSPRAAHLTLATFPSAPPRALL